VIVPEMLTGLLESKCGAKLWCAKALDAINVALTAIVVMHAVRMRGSICPSRNVTGQRATADAF
jgi:hypothetical protein